MLIGFVGGAGAGAGAGGRRCTCEFRGIDDALVKTGSGFRTLVGKRAGTAYLQVEQRGDEEKHAGVNYYIRAERLAEVAGWHFCFFAEIKKAEAWTPKTIRLYLDLDSVQSVGVERQRWCLMRMRSGLSSKGSPVRSNRSRRSLFTLGSKGLCTRGLSQLQK